MTSWQIFKRSFVEKEGYLDYLKGLEATAIIAILGLIIGVFIGTVIAVIKVIPKYKKVYRVLEKICDVYVGFFRGTPIVVQLLLGYYVLFPAIGIPISGMAAAIIIFGLNSGAYVSEIMRSGIMSVDIGQMEAGRSLGLSYSAAMVKIVLPQAVKNILPTLGNEFIVLIKETSVVSFIAVVDITMALKSIAVANYDYMIPYLFLALTYLILVYGITLIIKALERRMRKSDRNH